MSEMKTSFGSAIQGLAGLESFVRCDIGHGLTESNRNDTARTSSLARRLTDRTFLHKLNRMERWMEDDTDTYDKEGKGEKRRRKREEGRRLHSRSRFEKVLICSAVVD